MRSRKGCKMERFGFLKQVCIIFVVCGATAVGSLAQTVSTLFSFDGTDGANPFGGLIQATDGNFYGTTYDGGTSGNCSGGCGTVFKITPKGVLTKLHSFHFTDGAQPYAGLIQTTNGNFYGTTSGGGTGSACVLGCGTVFKITPEGVLTTLHNFDFTDGAIPLGGLIQATDGNFYGATINGGKGSACGGCGTVFKITPEGVLTTLHNFDGTDGANPLGALLQATDGDFYGATVVSVFSPGTVFKI